MPLYSLFFIGSLVIICSIQFIFQYQAPGSIQWHWNGLPAIFPFFNTILFDLLCWILVFFLSLSKNNARKNSDSAVVFQVRPVGNLYLSGAQITGIFTSILLQSLLIMFSGCGLDLLFSYTHFTFSYYVFYWITLTIPTLLFFIGLSVFLISWLKNNWFILISMFLAVLLTILHPHTQYGLYDVFGRSLPNVFSEMTGHPHLSLYLQQRALYFLLGLSLIFFAILFNPRLINKKKVNIIIATTLLCLALIMGLSFSYYFYNLKSVREDFRAIYSEVSITQSPKITQHEIHFTKISSELILQSKISILNDTDSTLNHWNLYLNPGLTILSCRENETELFFRRDKQKITLERLLVPGEKIDILMQYQGIIDPKICYLDISIDDIFNEQRSIFKYGFHPIFSTSDYTLLIPETLWYPTANPPVIPSSPFATKSDYTHFTLHVNNSDDYTVISQGERKKSAKGITFTPSYPLPGISLVIGDYMHKKITVDSLDINLFLTPENSSLLEAYASLTQKDVKDVIQRQLSYLQEYPFHQLLFVETPVGFYSFHRNWKSQSEYIQPEMFLFKENAFWGSSRFHKVSTARGITDSIELKNVIKQELQNNISFLFEKAQSALYTPLHTIFEGKKMASVQRSNPHDLSTLFYNYNCNIISTGYIGINHAIKHFIQEDKKPRQHRNTTLKDVNAYLASHSLKEAIEDTALSPFLQSSILAQKGYELSLFNQLSITEDHFLNFWKKFQQKHLFSNVELPVLIEAIQKEYGIDWNEFLPTWYKQCSLPTYYITDFQNASTRIDEEQYFYYSTKIINTSPQDGIIRVWLENTKYQWEIPDYGVYAIKAGACNEIGFFSKEDPFQMVVEFGISNNQPTQLIFENERKKIIPLYEFRQHYYDTLPPSAYQRECDPVFFMPKENEIIVDNRDEGFCIVGGHMNRWFTSLFVEQEAGDGGIGNKWEEHLFKSAFGQSILSAHCRYAGKGDTQAVWKTNINKAGKYEVFVYKPSRSETAWIYKDADYHYTVTHGQGEDVVSLPLFFSPQGWYSLGEFDFQEGVARVSLSDKSDEEMIIIADAVKWVRKM